ncbi:short-chain dehydrogenase reductase 3b-like [Arachis ipaensis]|uniref:short-chain dehydrogenase reductase 3b-like n=1 Tax=Arachis ipaensis TaxID=130454 RepID=UPI0007AF36B9|nr:short-chain dehydrogenase reductase 3b-like [Arachis ipaensis]XP_025662499.1 short-chain dehydrogenase reductase 3b-like [Arachis hypogaea]
MSSKQRLEGKVAIVTGGASGIGAEAARLFVENGALVVIADVNDELGLQVASSIGVDKVSYHHCDVRDEKQVEKTVAFAMDKYGSLDIMFSNAGVMGSLCNILDLDLNDFDNTVAVNVRGAAACIKHAARVMVERKTRGSIICTASVASMVALGGDSAGHGYNTSKHGLVGLVRSACGELGAYGIRVNPISPYVMATPLACEALGMEASEVESAGVAGANLQGIVLKPIHVAQTALFLASNESAYISGHNLVIDGGLLAVNCPVSKSK